MTGVQTCALPISNIEYESAGDSVRFETIFNETTYLTSAGTCQFGQTCTSGVLNYRASMLPLSNVTEPELQGTRVEIHTDGLLGFKNADSGTTSTFTALLGNELNIGADELSEVVLEASIYGTEVVLSNLVIGREDTDEPILYFNVVTEDGLSEYDYVSCYWENQFSDSSFEYWGFGSYGYFFSFETYTFYWWDDAVVDAVEAAPEQVEVQRAAASPTRTPTPTPTRTISPTRTPAHPSATRTPSHQCSPIHVEPIYYDDDDNVAYIHCSLDGLLSDEFFSYGSFNSFARVRASPLQRLATAVGDITGLFRL